MIKMIKNEDMMLYFTSSEAKDRFFEGEIQTYNHYYGEDHIELVECRDGNADIFYLDEPCPWEEVEEKGKLLASYEWYKIREDRINPPGGFMMA